jgi:hypothetical protein
MKLEVQGYQNCALFTLALMQRKKFQFIQIKY